MPSSLVVENIRQHRRARVSHLQFAFRHSDNAFLHPVRIPLTHTAPIADQITQPVSCRRVRPSSTFLRRVRSPCPQLASITPSHVVRRSQADRLGVRHCGEPVPRPQTVQQYRNDTTSPPYDICTDTFQTVGINISQSTFSRRCRPPARSTAGLFATQRSSSCQGRHCNPRAARDIASP